MKKSSMALRTKLIEENEARYGKEARERFGSQTVEASNAKLRTMTREQHEALERLSQEMMRKLRQAKAQGDPKGPLAQEAADMHRQWLSLFLVGLFQASARGSGQDVCRGRAFHRVLRRTGTGRGGVPARRDSLLYRHGRIKRERRPNGRLFHATAICSQTWSSTFLRRILRFHRPSRSPRWSSRGTSRLRNARSCSRRI